MKRNMPVVAAFLGQVSIVVGTAGLIGYWWALIVAGVLATAWAVLATADRSHA